MNMVNVNEHVNMTNEHELMNVAKRFQLFERAARCAHEMNPRWCELNGDMSQSPPEECSAEARRSAIEGVHAIYRDRSITPQLLHENWMVARRWEGWVYGPVKNRVTREHPCLVDYSELHPIQQAKDALFIAVAKSVLQCGEM